ncbi:MAG: hypothetical protein AUG01_11250 [Candidatus Rokubacteria bacterium 13_1_20CM_2_69_58]|nr:MAG: hypothetical protein AUG01_11250 [Candidatus Rokubacteria bacterium 13_1_20CM_2_69_58]
MQRDRAELLRALIAYELPIEPVLAELRSFEWDSPNPLVVLTREDIVRILDRYLAGELGAAEVTVWADLIECRDDIGFPGGDEDLLSDALFRLANPNLRGDVTPELGQIIRRELIGTHSGTS